MTADSTSSSVAIYIASVIALWGIAWCHDTYKDSKKCRTVMKEAGFFDLVDMEQPKAERLAECMRFIFRGWPITVSEMVHDDNTPHGTLFRCLVSAAAIIMYGAEWGTLSPGAESWPVLSQIRALACFFGVFGIAFAPSSKAFFGPEYRDMFLVALKRGRYTEEEYEIERIHGDQTKLHALVALTVFFLSPVLEAFNIGVGFWTMATASDWEVYTTASAMSWVVLQLVRVFLVYTIFVHLMYFPVHMNLAVVRGTMHSYQCFSSEYSLVISYCFLGLLLGVSSFFDPTVAWTDKPILMTAKMAAAAWHVYIIVPYAYTRLRICVWSNSEYTTEELGMIFGVWKEREIKKRGEFEAANEALAKLKDSIAEDDECAAQKTRSNEWPALERVLALKRVSVLPPVLEVPSTINDEEDIRLVKLRRQSVMGKKSK